MKVLKKIKYILKDREKSNTSDVVEANVYELVPEGKDSGSSTALATTYDNTTSGLYAENVQELGDELAVKLIDIDLNIDAISSGFQGTLSILDTPATDGYYLANETGTYVNAGNLEVDTKLGVSFISKIGSNFKLSVYDIGTEKKDTREILKKLHQTKNNILSIPFFDDKYVSNTEFNSLVGSKTVFTGTGAIVGDGYVTMEANSRYVASNDMPISQFNNYMCLSYKSLEAGDNWLFGSNTNTGYSVLLRSTTLILATTGGASYTWALPSNFDITKPITIQIVTHDSNLKTAFINGKKLIASNVGSINTQAGIGFIGRNTLGNNKSLRGNLIYYKISNSLPTEKQLNDDLITLNSLTDNVSEIEKIINPYKPIVNVLIVGGQSNGQGRGKSDQKPLIGISNKVEYFDKSTLDLKPFGVYERTAEADFGLQEPFFDVISRYRKYDKLLYVEFSPGGSSFINNNWNKGNTAYETLVTNVLGLKERVLNEDYTLNFVFLFVHGETDGDTSGGANNYEAALSTFLTDFKTDVSIPNLKVVISRLSDTQTGVTELAKIRQAQENVIALSNDYYLLNIDGFESDGIHFTTNGYVSIGYTLKDVIESNNLFIGNISTI